MPGSRTDPSAFLELQLGDAMVVRNAGGITYGAIVTLIGAIDSFTVSTTPAADLDFELTGEERAQLDALDRTGGTGSALENKWW